MHLDIGRPDPREPPQRADEGDGVGRTFCRIALHARGDAVLIEVGTTGRFGDQMIAGAFSDAHRVLGARPGDADRSEEHTSELQSLMRISYAVFCLKKKIKIKTTDEQTKQT